MKYALFMLMCFVCMVIAGHARALDFTVDTPTDDPLLDACTDETPEDCSLRGAILKANATADADTIALGAETYLLTVVPDGTPEDGEDGDLDITAALTITGASAKETIIDGNAIDRVFHIDPGLGVDHGFSVTIADLTIQHGHSADGMSTGTEGQPGGGILMEGGNVSLQRVHITSNRTGDGADGDNVIDPGNGGVGGGIACYLGKLEIRDSAITKNETGNDGKGSPMFSNTGGGLMVGCDTSILNTTISGNRTGVIPGTPMTTATSGAGIGMDGVSSNIRLNNVTIAENVLQGDTGGMGAGVLFTKASVGNTIIAGNQGPDTASRIDCVAALGPVTSEGSNLIGDGTDCDGFTDGVLDDQVGSSVDPISPLLGSLADNGGPTPTHALLAGSPALDRGDISDCESNDQRGVTRPVDGDDDGTADCDIGAVEQEVCGNGVIETPVETCDDGNTASGDGCSESCQIEDADGDGDDDGDGNGGNDGDGAGGGCQLIR